MKITQATALAILGAATVSASAIPQRRDETLDTTTLHFYNGTCTSDIITTRKEWRSLTADEKKAYLDAELCLMSLPAQTTLDGVTSRYSDMQALHRSKTNTTLNGIYVQDIIHNVGQFLPWHRLFMHAHETLLRTECNYTGTMPWWDEAKDADAGYMFSSDMWTSEYFGGNGDPNDDWCLKDGVFANTTEHMGPLLEDTDYCYKREFDNSQLSDCTSEAVAACTQYNDYYTFFNCMVAFPNSPHVAGHSAVGGLMADIDNSAGDPTFYMHHLYIDRMWWQWQQANATYRMFDISGNSLNTTYLADEGMVAPPGGYLNTTLGYVLNVADLVPDQHIYDVVNIQGGYLCYDYEY